MTIGTGIAGQDMMGMGCRGYVLDAAGKAVLPGAAGVVIAGVITRDAMEGESMRVVTERGVKVYVQMTTSIYADVDLAVAKDGRFSAAQPGQTVVAKTLAACPESDMPVAAVLV